VLLTVRCACGRVSDSLHKSKYTRSGTGLLLRANIYFGTDSYVAVSQLLQIKREFYLYQHYITNFENKYLVNSDVKRGVN
jgi:hypothetical protein